MHEQSHNTPEHVLNFRMPGLACWLGLLITLVLAAWPSAYAQESEAALNLGRELTEQFYAGEISELFTQFSDELAEAIGGEPGLRAFRDGFLAEVGAESEVRAEEVVHRLGAQVYQRTVVFEPSGVAAVIEWALDEQGTVIGFFIGPAGEVQEAPTEFLNYETQADLRLPFEDEWLVVWGGRTVGENYHAAYPDQRFAYDFVVVRDGATHTSTGESNEDYYCFGLPLVAPGAGTVVAAVGSEPDRTPGELIDEQPLGNHVIIDHGNGEFSFLAHFRQDSVVVTAGQQVEAGDLLGECGNSGRSSEPHLHYHLQTTPDFGQGEGLPAQFNSYEADGEAVERGEPVQGQLVRHID